MAEELGAGGGGAGAVVVAGLAAASGASRPGGPTVADKPKADEPSKPAASAPAKAPTKAQKGNREKLQALVNRNLPAYMRTGDVLEDAKALLMAAHYMPGVVSLEAQGLTDMVREFTQRGWSLATSNQVTNIPGPANFSSHPTFARLKTAHDTEQARIADEARIAGNVTGAAGEDANLAARRGTGPTAAPPAGQSASDPNVRAELAGAGVTTTSPAPGTTTSPAPGATDGVTPTANAPTQPAAPGSPPAPAAAGTVGSGSSGGGGTGTAAAPVSAATAAATGDGSPVQIPAASEAQLWLVDGGTYILSWNIPGTQTSLFYNVDNPQTLDAIFQGNVVVDREITTDGTTDPATWLEAQGQYGFFGGQVSEIQNTDENPWAGQAAKWKDKARFVPWLNNPDVLAWLAEGMIEQDGRVLTPQAAREAGLSFAEGKSTGELTRELEIFNMSEGQIATQRSIHQTTVEGVFYRAGITVDDNTRGAVEVAIDKLWRGEWDVNVLQNEVNLFADPVTRERSALSQVEGLGEVISLRSSVAEIRSQVEDYVGPAVAALLGDRWFESWAEQVRNDPNGQAKLDEALQGLRVAHFGAYGNNPGLRYQDLASPVRGLARNTLGETLDESDPFFLSLVQGNDLSEAGKQLRKYGLDNGDEKVTNNVLSEMGRAFGGQVVRSA